MQDRALPLPAAEYVAKMLQSYGITHVFFVDAIMRRSLVEMEALGIHRVLTHSEKAAAYMADGYSRIRRGPGVCMCQSVGAANLAAGLQDGYLDLSAVIAITGKKEQSFQYRNAYQEVDHGSLFKAVTKFGASAEVKEQLPLLLRQAFREACSGAPGPVHLDVLGHMGQVADQWEILAGTDADEAYRGFPSQRPVPEANSIREAAALLALAERPVIVAGGGAVASSAHQQIGELAEMLSAPVVTSPNAKAILVETHPLLMGVVGTYSRSFANRIVAEADLVLVVGSRTGDMVTHNWTLLGPRASVVQIDVDAAQLGRNYPNKVSLLGDARAALSDIIDILRPEGNNPEWAKRCQQAKNQWLADVEPLRESSDHPIRPERLCKEISEVLPPQGIVVADTGYSSFWTAAFVYLNHPEQAYLRAAGSLGWAFPASLGVKCAAPHRPVLCFTGDGGFWYHMSELETARRCNINTVTVVNNNSGFSQCETNIKRIYGETLGKAHELYRFREVNFARVAEEFGCLGIRVDRPEALKGALEEALAAATPSVIDVVTDERCKVNS